jgi:hypothetical protein
MIYVRENEQREIPDYNPRTHRYDWDADQFVPLTAQELERWATADRKREAAAQTAKAEAWFAWYDGQVSQAQRAQRTGMAWAASDGVRTYNTLAELDAEANAKQGQIQTLRAQRQNLI